MDVVWKGVELAPEMFSLFVIGHGDPRKGVASTSTTLETSEVKMSGMVSSQRRSLRCWFLERISVFRKVLRKLPKDTRSSMVA